MNTFEYEKSLWKNYCARRFPKLIRKFLTRQGDEARFRFAVESRHGGFREEYTHPNSSSHLVIEVLHHAEAPIFPVMAVVVVEQRDPNGKSMKARFVAYDVNAWMPYEFNLGDDSFACRFFENPEVTSVEVQKIFEGVKSWERSFFREKWTSLPLKLKVQSEILRGISIPQPIASDEMFLTSGQKLAMQSLREAWELKLLSPKIGGITVRANPLFCGASGSGKTSVIRLFCEQNGIPLFGCTTSSWVVSGSSSKNFSLWEALQFTRKHPRGCFMIDEVDKISDAICEGSSGGWFKSVMDEIYALADGDEKLLIHNFFKDDIEHLKRDFLIVGAGAWQDTYKQLRAPKCVFGQKNGVAASLAESIAKNANIPDELLFRFSDPIEVQQPTAQDFCNGIFHLHYSLNFLPPKNDRLAELIEQGLRSDRGMRFLEMYLRDLLLQNPNLIDHVEAPLSSRPAQLRVFEFTKLRDEWINAMRELFDACQMLVFELARVRECPECAHFFDSKKSNDIRQSLFGCNEMCGLIQNLRSFLECRLQLSAGFIFTDRLQSLEKEFLKTEIPIAHYLTGLLEVRPLIARKIGIFETAAKVVNLHARAAEIYESLLHEKI